MPLRFVSAVLPAFVFAFLSTLQPRAQGVVSPSGRMLTLRGAIDKYPITMSLVFASGEVTGSYYYDRIMESIPLIGREEKGRLELSAYYAGKEETFSLTPSGAGYGGRWMKEGKAPGLSVGLTPREQSFAFNVYRVRDSFKVFPSEESAHCSIDILSVWPKGNTAAEAFLRQRIVGLLDRENRMRDVTPGLLRRLSNDHMRKYKEDLKEVDLEELKESPNLHTYELISRLQVKWEQPNLIVLEDMSWEYSGGAHGNGASLYHVFDLGIRRKLALKDVVTPSGMKALLPVLERRYRASVGAKPTTRLSEAGLFEDRIPHLSENFYVTGKGVCFSYTPYEIAPYASGQVEIYVPYSEIMPYLQPGFKVLMGI